MTPRKSVKPALLLAVLLVASAAAAAPAATTYFFGGKPRKFLQLAGGRIQISENCLRGDGQYRCQAYEALKHVSLKPLEEPGALSGGKNPGAVLCHKLGAEVVLGLDDRKNRTTFCHFQDGSEVESSSLYFMGRANDQDKKG